MPLGDLEIQSDCSFPRPGEMARRSTGSLSSAFPFATYYIYSRYWRLIHFLKYRIPWLGSKWIRVFETSSLVVQQLPRIKVKATWIDDDVTNN